MGAYTVKNLKEVDNQAVHFGLEPSQLELRMARVPLECENSGVSYLKLGPDGYGSISSWYQWRSSAASGSGFGVWKAPASSQTRCHFASICFGSYLSMATKKPLA